MTPKKKMYATWNCGGPDNDNDEGFWELHDNKNQCLLCVGSVDEIYEVTFKSIGRHRKDTKIVKVKE